MAYPHSYLTILVVVFNETPDTSAATKAVVDLDGIAGANIIIWDNSKPSQSAKFQLFFAKKSLAVNYVHTPENLPLSVIYNRVADAASGEGFLLILDQDTVLPRDYLSIFLEAVRDSPSLKLFAPTIRVGHKLVSPSPYFAGWGRAWRQARIGPHSTRQMTIINSGLFASIALFQQDGVRYDERLKLYGTDTGFFRSYARHDAQFYILPVVIDHHLSFDTADLGAKAAKLNQMLAANDIIYALDGWLVRASVAAVEVVVRLRYTLRYRSLIFLRSAV